MINVSNAFREQLNNDNRNYLCYVKITLSDQTVLNVENDKLWSSGVEIERAVSNDNSFDIGSVIINKATVVLNNIYDDFSDYDFSDAKVYIEIGLELENRTIEKVKIGTFYVDEPRYNGSIITLECLDIMSNFDKNYSESNLTYPATLLQIVQDACSVCNVNNGISTLPNGQYTVEEKPNTESLTFRQMLQWVGQISSQWFTIDSNNRLVSGWYNTSEYETMSIISGGKIGEDVEDLINSGTFGDGLQNYISSGEFGESINYHFIDGISSFSVDTDDVVITGLKVTECTESTEEDPETVQYGEDGYVLEISGNKLITKGNATSVASYVGSKIVGLRFRPFSVTCQNDPSIEAGDEVILCDYKGNLFQSFITNIRFSVGNSEDISCGAVSAKRNSASRYSKVTQAYVDNRNSLKKQKTEWEKDMEELTDRVNNSSGLYMTKEPQPDGSNIYYMHNKPTLEESLIISKMTAEAMAVSTDGGKTYNAGLTVDGEMIAKIMNTIGINFDWGVGGTLIIRTPSGEQTLYVNAKTGDVRIVATSFTLKGKSVEEIAQEQVNNFVSSVYDPKIAELQKQIDGQIETWYYDYQPTLSNIPASNWKTESDRAKHEGDLFYWKSKGYAYRFFKNGSTWTWQMVQDTDVTKALQQAAEAQDTADAKRRVFVVTPTPPYEVGDLWVGNSSSDLKRCQTTRSSGNYVSGDWIKAVKYTDDSALNAFVNGDFKETIEDVKTQADKKAETWYQSSDPSTAWTTTTLKNEHKGDIWFNTSSSVQKSYRWSGTTWQEMKTTPPDEVFDKIDGKARVFVSTPMPPYDKGDLWFNSATSDIMTCVTSRTSGSYVSSDWQKRNKYTDDSAVTALDKSLTQQDVFNRLTNNGQIQGIYLKNGRLYINATYIDSGTMSANLIKGGTLILGGASNGNGKLSILNSSGSQVGYIDNTGAHFNQGTFSGNLQAAGGTFEGTLSADCITGGSMSADRISGGNFDITVSNKGKFRVIDAFDDEIMLIDYDGMKINPFLSLTWGITVSDTLEILGGSYGQIFSRNTNNNKTVYISQSAIGIFEGLGYSENIMNSYVKMSVYNNQGRVAITDPGNLAKVFSSMDADGIFTSGTKSRLVKTSDYGDRFHYCYEMPSPMFGDIGEAQTDENGECYLFIDDIFKETVTTNIEYQVFLQKEGRGDIWIEEKNEEYFVVKGTSNLKFSWELKARQRGYELQRLEERMEEDDYSEPNYGSLAESEIKKIQEIDYESEASQMLENYYKGLEGAFI